MKLRIVEIVRNTFDRFTDKPDLKQTKQFRLLLRGLFSLGLAMGLTFILTGTALAERLTAPLAQAEGGENLTPVFLAFILALSIFLGFELIAKVPATLHTPLMSGSNAISGITMVGALVAAGHSSDLVSTILGTLAVAFASTNVVGGYLVTDRMLEMFKVREKPAPQLEDGR